MSSLDDDRLLQRLGEALAAPAVEPTEAEVAGLRHAVSRLARRVRQTPLVAAAEPATEGPSPRRVTRTCGDPDGLVALSEAVEALARPRRVG